MEQINVYLQKVATKKEYDKGHTAAAVGLGSAGAYGGYHVGGYTGTATGLAAGLPGEVRKSMSGKRPIASNVIRSSLKGGKIGAVAGIVAGAYAGKKLADKVYEKKAEFILEKIYEKQAGIGSTILNAGKAMGKAIIGDAKALPGQVKNVGSAFKANGGGVKGLTSPGTVSTMKSVVKNKAVLTGASVVGAGVLAGRSSKQ